MPHSRQNCSDAKEMVVRPNEAPHGQDSLREVLRVAPAMRVTDQHHGRRDSPGGKSASVLGRGLLLRFTSRGEVSLPIVVSVERGEVEMNVGALVA